MVLEKAVLTRSNLPRIPPGRIKPSTPQAYMQVKERIGFQRRSSRNHMCTETPHTPRVTRFACRVHFPTRSHGIQDARPWMKACRVTAGEAACFAAGRKSDSLACSTLGPASLCGKRGRSGAEEVEVSPAFAALHLSSIAVLFRTRLIVQTQHGSTAEPTSPEKAPRCILCGPITDLSPPPAIRRCWGRQHGQQSRGHSRTISLCPNRTTSTKKRGNRRRRRRRRRRHALPHYPRGQGHENREQDLLIRGYMHAACRRGGWWCVCFSRLALRTGAVCVANPSCVFEDGCWADGWAGQSRWMDAWMG